MPDAFQLARERARAHEELVDAAGALAALADRPYHQRLAAAGVAARRNTFCALAL